MVKTKERLADLEKRLNEKFDIITDKFEQVFEELRVARHRLISIESWLAALSKGKDFSKSHAFAKDITDLQERKNPKTDENGKKTITSSVEWERNPIVWMEK